MVLRTQHSAHTSTSDIGTIPWAKRSCIFNSAIGDISARIIAIIADLALFT